LRAFSIEPISAGTDDAGKNLISYNFGREDLKNI